MKREKRIDVNRILMSLCIAVLIFFMCTVVLRFFTRQILILKLGVENQFTSAVFFDDASMATSKEQNVSIYGETDDYSMDWAAVYPFDGEEECEANSETNHFSLIGRYTSAIDSMENRIQRYTQTNLVGYSYLTELANRLEKTIGWNFSSYSEYNGIFRLDDGYWSSLKSEQDMTEHIRSLNDLADYCRQFGGELIYVQAPYKISKYDDTDISGYLDFSNQNADALISGLKGKEIPVLDLRESLHERGNNLHSYFFVSDHHWKPETGLWAAGEICYYFDQQLGWNIDAELMSSDRFSQKVYKDWFLGSLGKKVTLGKAEPEDIALLYPDYDTRFHYEIPSIGMDVIGDFSVTYNMEAVEIRDYYSKSPYAAYNFGDRALIRLENQYGGAAQKLLVIHDSFADSVVPFMALGIQAVESIDLRYFNGSLQRYLDESQPDCIVVMYNAGEISHSIDYSTHTDLFDFR